MAASRIAAFSRIGVLLSLCALLLILTLENWLNQPLSISRWLIQTIPLLAFLPGLISNKLRAYQWLCFVILLYFISGVLNIFTPEKLISGIMLTLFCVLLFCFAIFYVRDEQKNKSA
ncbi:MAG: DUF2069 domain-containing protein [Pseudohongiellaceae bacterium]